MKKASFILCLAASVCFAACGNTESAGTQAPEAGADSLGVHAIAQSGIVYFEIDRVQNEYDMATDSLAVLQAQLEALQQEEQKEAEKIESSTKSKQAAIEKEAAKLQEDYQKGLILPSSAQQKQEDIQARAARLQEEYNSKLQSFQNKYGPKEQELQMRMNVISNNIANNIKQYVDNVFNADGRYSMILASQSGLLPLPVVSADPSLDVTDAIIAGLNREYVENKKK